VRVVVVGAGIVGASTAFHLSDRGADVIVVDGARHGAATLAGAGIICPWPTAHPDGDYVERYVESAHGLGPIVERLSELGETATSFRRVGAVFLAETSDDLAEVEGRVARRAGADPTVGDVHRISGSDARDLFPPLRDDLPGLFIGGGARLDGRAFTVALLRAGRLVPVSGDAELVVDGDRVRGVVVGSETLSADAVVVAGGAWTSRLLEPLGVRVDLEPQKGQIVHLRSPALARIRPTSEWPSILPPGPHYLLAFDDDRVVVGATRETGSGFDTRPTVAGQREVLDAAVEWAPGLSDAEVIEFRTGLRPFAPSGAPTIGAVYGIDGLYVGTGMGAGGLTMGPHAGRCLADDVLAG
jgi:D-amino-acid dehydrogenase